MRNVWKGLWTLVVAGAVVLLASSCEQAADPAVENERDPAEPVVRALDEALARQEAAIDSVARRFEAIDDLKTAQELRLRRYRNAAHVERARRLGVGSVAGTEAIERLVEQDRLVRLPDTTEYFYLQEFDYSVPYVTPDAARLLTLIGEHLHEELRRANLPLYRFNVSSVLRTGENQQALRQINPNAARGVSAHEFGTTIDIVVHIYDYVPREEDALPGTAYAAIDERLESMRRRHYSALGMRYWRHLKGLLGRVLIELQDEGLVLVTLEREQPVFHITVGRRVSGGA